MRTIAIINQKGGCGKTTTAINLSAAAASRGRRVLLIDLDPQSHCALGLSVPPASIERQIGDAMLGDLSRPNELGDLRWQVGANFDLIPSSVRLAALESMNGGLARLPDRDRRLEQLLRWHSQDYDLCVLDCPPHIGLLTYNALRAATDVLIPVETSYFALQGAENQMKTIASVSRRIGRSMNAMLLPTMYDEQQQLSCEILLELRKRFSGHMAPLEIRYCVALRESASFGQPIHEYAPNSTACQDYDHLLTWMEQQSVKPITFLAGVDTLAETGAGQALPFVPGSEGGSYWPTIETTPGAAVFQSHQPLYPGRDSGGSPSTASSGGQAPSGVPAHQPGNRAAELAQRARTLLQRQHELQARMEADRRLNEAYAPVMGDLTDAAPLNRPLRTSDRPGREHDQAPRDTGAARPPSSTDLLIEDEVATHPTRLARMEGLKANAMMGAAIPRGVRSHPTPGVSLVEGRVRFVYRSRACVEKVEVAGDFNRWIPAQGHMEFSEEHGVFEVWFELAPGRYRYCLVVDGRWIVDPDGAAIDTNESGEHFSVFEIGAQPTAGVQDARWRSAESDGPRAGGPTGGAHD